MTHIRLTVSDLRGTGASLPHPTLMFSSPRGLLFSDRAVTELLLPAKDKSDIPAITATAHGLFSSFRDWASEHGYSRDLAERALAGC